jgi:hypothetical protein
MLAAAKLVHVGHIYNKQVTVLQKCDIVNFE